MERHLWDEHRLILDGSSVRAPWRLVEDWIEQYRNTGETVWLERSRDLGQRLDALHGRQRVQRLLLSQGVDDGAALQDLAAEAERRHASLCPHCFAMARPRLHPQPRPPTLSHDHISGGGYRVRIAERGLWPRLTVQTPGRMVYDGHEPGRRWTTAGSTLLFAGPPVLTALLLDLLAPWIHRRPLLPVLALLVLSCIIYAVVRLLGRGRAAPRERVIDHAWTTLVPALHGEGFSISDAEFLAGLATVSVDRGQAVVRAAALRHVLDVTAKAVSVGECPVVLLVPLQRLAMADAARGGTDVIPQVAQQIGQALQGRLPLAAANLLLSEWESSIWDALNLQRLRILICELAFECGFEVRDLVGAGRDHPALAEVLGTDDTLALARLRLLWGMRPRRPWDFAGAVTTVFEVAAQREPSTLHLEKTPDLLLFARNRPQVALCGRGLFFQGELFEKLPAVVEIREIWRMFGRDYELSLDERRFAFATDPDAIVKQLERWFRFYFREFHPQLEAVRNWVAPAPVAALLSGEAIPCPDCERTFFARVGDVGIASTSR
jgi:hypothetical protein